MENTEVATTPTIQEFSDTFRFVTVGLKSGLAMRSMGLTLGGVGNGTQIDHVEVVGNLDDGIECFRRDGRLIRCLP